MTKNNHIINSLLDLDLYKISMFQTVLHQFPRAHVKFRFKCRSDKNLAKYLYEINQELDQVCSLRFTQDELSFLSDIRYIKSDCVDYMGMLQLRRDFIRASIDPETDDLDIVAEGPWRDVIWFETLVLSIVQEVYTRNEYPGLSFEEGRNRLNAKIERIREYTSTGKEFLFSDFGTRRRFSFDWHNEMLSTLTSRLDRHTLCGTSNVLFAKEYGLKPIGTMAHEFLQAGQQLGPRLVDSQKFMLQAWVDEYRGDLGIALSDVFGIDAFLRDFDLYFSKLYDGVRHDSGEPKEWGDKIINHYKGLGIDPRSKSAVFSDGLDIDKAIELNDYFHNRIRCSFGIGTNLSNDMGVKPLSIVMKMVECNGAPVAKVSDTPGKGMCEDPEYLDYVYKVFKIAR